MFEWIGVDKFGRFGDGFINFWDGVCYGVKEVGDWFSWFDFVNGGFGRNIVVDFGDVDKDDVI